VLNKTLMGYKETMTEIACFTTNGAAARPIHALRAGAFKPWIELQGEALIRQAQAQDFKAQAGRILYVHGPDGGVARIVYGLGENGSPLQFGALASALAPGDYALAEAPANWNVSVAVLAWGLGAYQFDRYKPRKRPAPRLAAPDGVDMGETETLLRASYLARDLVNTPASDMGPEALQSAAETIARAHGATIETIVGDDLIVQNYPLIHAVGRAAHQAPRLVRLSWGEENAPRVTLVGKGVTFDSGGLDIKPTSGMRIMKKDMGGAAHALALGQIAMELGLKARLDIYLPIVENAISANAFRPGDVIKSRKGLTIEIDNTDAEGRLVLADALARASEDKPDLMIDFATLTGAARVALGPDLPPVYTDDDALASELATASAAQFDPMWRMPLWRAYEPDMDSPIADMINGGDSGMAGSIYGALFLKRFVDARAWAHFDIYAWAPKDRAARPKGGEAQGLRACWQVLKQRYGARA